MTKKMVSIILIITIFLSVIAMAVWGKLPETTQVIQVTEIVFYDEKGQVVTELNDSEKKEKKITIDTREKEVTSYTFQVKLLPADATDLKVEFSLDSGDATIEEVEYVAYYDDSSAIINENGENLHTYTITFNEQHVTTLSFTSNYSGTRRIRDYLMFVFEGEEFSDDVIL